MFRLTSSVVQVSFLDGIRSRDSLVRFAISEEQDQIINIGPVVSSVLGEQVLSGKVETS